MKSKIFASKTFIVCVCLINFSCTTSKPRYQPKNNSADDLPRCSILETQCKDWLQTDSRLGRDSKIWSPLCVRQSNVLHLDENGKIKNCISQDLSGIQINLTADTVFNPEQRKADDQAYNEKQRRLDENLQKDLNTMAITDAINVHN